MNMDKQLKDLIWFNEDLFWNLIIYLLFWCQRCRKWVMMNDKSNLLIFGHYKSHHGHDIIDHNNCGSYKSDENKYQKHVCSVLKAAFKTGLY